MKARSLEKIVAHCQALLKVEEFEDWAEAMNGLQVQNSGKVTRIAAAVDISPRTVKMACDAGADLLMIHHGFFWGGICADRLPAGRSRPVW